MRKVSVYLLIAFLVASLGLANAEATREIPSNNTPVTIVSGPKGIKLDSAFRAAAESAGYIYLSRDVPDRNLQLKLKSVPFSEVWDLLMKTYGDNIDNAFVDNKIVVVASHGVINRIIEQGGLSPRMEEVKIPNAVIEVVPVKKSDGLLEALAGLFPEVQFNKLNDPPALIVKALPAQVEEVKNLLREAGVLIEGDLAAILQDEEAKKREWSLAVFYLQDKGEAGIKPAMQALERIAPNSSFTYVPAAQALVAKGNVEELVQAKGLLDRLGLLRTRDEVERSSIRLTKVYDLGTGMKAGAQIIESIVGDRGIVNYDENSGYLYVYAAPDAHEDIEQAVAEFRQTVAEKEPEVKAEPGSTLLYYETKREPSYVASYIAKVLPDAKLVPMDDAGLLMVVGAPDVQRKIARILDEIDRVDPKAQAEKERLEQLKKDMEPIHATYECAYHNAQSLAELLKQIVASAPSSKTGTTNGGGEDAPSQKADVGAASAGSLKITADAQTNMLLLYGPRRDVETALEFAKKLDRPADQVISRVWIQEVDRSAANELGINWQYATGKFVVSLTDGVFTAGYDSAATALSALSQSIRLLEKTGRSRRLLDANTLTLNAEPTTLLSGGKLLLPRQQATEGDTEGGGGGFEEFNYGLNLVLTPFTSPDGTITLDIATTVGSLPQSGPTPGSVMLPQSYAESRIRIKDGQAVILGGVISNEERNDESGIPILKDIPVIGALFKTSERVTSEQLLLIIVESHIVRADSTDSNSAADVTPPESDLPTGEVSNSEEDETTVSTPAGELPTEPWSDRATRVAPIGGDK